VSRLGGLLIACVVAACGEPRNSPGTTPDPVPTAPPVTQPPRPRIVGLTLDPSLTGGQTSSAAVEIDIAAPEGGLAVALSSDNNAAQVPATVTVPAGATRVTFVVTVQAVSSEVRATITATVSDESRAASMAIRAPVLRALNVQSAVASGYPASGMIHLDGPAGSASVSFTISTRVVFFRSSFVQITATQGGVSFASTLELLP
jgi:hypothetical protein